MMDSSILPDVRVPRVSPQFFAWFAWYGERMLRAHFHSIRVLKAFPPPRSSGSLCIFLNHASWWDPLTVLFLARRFFPNHRHFGPFEAKALRRYAILEKVGGFGVDLQSVAGARKFMQTSEAILHGPQNVLWITSQGRFADVRQRPLGLKRGVGLLMRKCPQVPFVPLSVEYPYWEESRPELLTAFGGPVSVASDVDRQTIPAARGERESQWYETQLCEASLIHVMDQLAVASQKRASEHFDILLHGSAGVGGWYDWVGSLKAKLVGQVYKREHSDK